MCFFISRNRADGLTVLTLPSFMLCPHWFFFIIFLLALAVTCSPENFKREALVRHRDPSTCTAAWLQEPSEVLQATTAQGQVRPIQTPFNSWAHAQCFPTSTIWQAARLSPGRSITANSADGTQICQPAGTAQCHLTLLWEQVAWQCHHTPCHKVI